MRRKPLRQVLKIVCIQEKSAWWNGQTGHPVFFRMIPWVFSLKCLDENTRKITAIPLLEKIQDKIVIFTSTICSPSGRQTTLSCPNTVNRSISTSFSYETLEETLDVKPKSSMLLIGVPKETAFQENRIGLTPEAVSVLISNGHQVLIEHNAGEAAHYGDRDYSEAGARIIYEKAEVYKCPTLIKVCSGSGRRSSPSANESDHYFSHSSCLHLNPSYCRK